MTSTGPPVSRRSTRWALRVLLLVAVIAQLLACHAVAMAAAEAPAAVQDIGGHGHGPASAGTCEPLGTTPVAGGCRAAAASWAGPRDVEGQQVGVVVLLILVAALAGSRRPLAAARHVVSGGQRLLAVGLIRV